MAPQAPPNMRLQRATLADTDELGLLNTSVSTTPRHLLSRGTSTFSDRLAYVTEATRRDLSCALQPPPLPPPLGDSSPALASPLALPLSSQCRCSDQFTVPQEISGFLLHPRETIVALKVLDTESGKIAGWGLWGLCKEAARMENQKETYRGLETLRPRGMKTELGAKYLRLLGEMNGRCVPSEECMILLHLATHPDFQRRGVGRTIVQWGLDIADYKGVRVYLTASPDGKKLYETMGFVLVDSFEVDLAEFGGEGRTGHAAMIREPKESKKENEGGEELPVIATND